VNSEDKKVLFIVNKYSGPGYLPAVEGKILEACQNNRVAYHIEFTEGPGHATILSGQAVANGFTTVVAVGGDGTVNEVAQGVIHTKASLGIIPTGSGNGLARHLKIPIAPVQALKTLFSSQVIAMDSFQMNGKLSLNVSGIGFDGHVANLFGTDKKRGLQAYTRLTFNEFRQFKEFDAELRVGGTILKKKAFVIAIANSSQYGNNARIAPAASVCDELLHISILKKMPPYRLDFIYSFFAGTINESAYCEILEARDLTIRLSAPVPYHIDGEASGTAAEFQIEMMPGSIQMMAPREIVRP
jgi:diacylglycerol kinase (ATP)